MQTAKCKLSVYFSFIFTSTSARFHMNRLAPNWISFSQLIEPFWRGFYFCHLLFCLAQMLIAIWFCVTCPNIYCWQINGFSITSAFCLNLCKIFSWNSHWPAPRCTPHALVCSHCFVFFLLVNHNAKITFRLVTDNIIFMYFNVLLASFANPQNLDLILL